MLLTEQYPYRVEMHAHTSPVSGCSQIEPEVLVDTYEQRGYDAVVITNHFHDGFLQMSESEAVDYYLSDYRKAQAHAKGKKLRVLLGMEIRFTENMNDYLLYGIAEEDVARARPYLDRGIDAFYKEFKTSDNMILQAHPFRDGMVRANPESLDGMETFNMHPHHNSRCALAQQYAAQHPHFVTIAGTDYHNFGYEGLTALRMKEAPDPKTLVAALQSRDYLLEIAGAVLLPYADSVYTNIQP